MPEGLEVEIYRRVAERVVGRSVDVVEADSRRADPGISAVEGERIVAARRIGKLLLLDTTGPTIGVHFGMTGRLVVDDHAPIERLEYGSRRDDPAWDRLVLRFVDGGTLRVNDPRRWSRTSIDPDVAGFGPDLLAVTAEELATVFAGRRAAVKGVLLDQGAVAGLGNMCVDEVLWHSAIAPTRPTGDLLATNITRLHRAMSVELPQMLARGGSHTGVINPEVRAVLPQCPLDGRPLVRSLVAGRTTVWCPHHQAAN